MRFIEVVATARVERIIEAYETSLELSTVSSRKIPCVDEANQLREAILKRLHQIGLAEQDITEGGGEASQNYWSTSKSVVHRIRIRNQDMTLLMTAMATTEKHFAAIRRGWFSGIRQNFNFLAPSPIYIANNSADESLREALRHARRTAEVAASESGCHLGNVISITEIVMGSKAQAFGTQPNDDPEGTVIEHCLFESDSMGALSYNGLPQSVARAVRRFLVRFAMVDTAPTQPSSSPPM